MSLKKIAEIKKKNLGLIIFFLLFYTISWFFLTFRILEVPPGINGDEAAIGYNAALVAKTGHDQSGKFLPLFISTFDLTDWKQPVTFYSIVSAFKIFGPSYKILREVSVIFVLISATLIFFLSKEILGLESAIFTLLIFMMIPAVYIQSHLALENIAPVPFITIWIWMLAKYQKSFKWRYPFLSALFLGISLFTYPGIRLIFPVFTVLSVFFIYYLNRQKAIKKILVEVLKFLLIVGIFPIFMYAIKSQYPGAILAYNRPHEIQSYQEFILPYISSFDPSFLFIQGDSTPYHSTGRQGVFLLATLPIFILGIVRIIRKNEPLPIFILFAFLFAPLLYGIASSIHRGSRLLVLLPCFAIISATGLSYLLSINKKWINLLTFAVLIIILFNYLDFIKDYWYEYPNRIKSDFAKPYHLVFEEAQKISRLHHSTVYIQNDLRSQNQIAENFFEEVYFPDKLKIWKGDQILPANSVIIVSEYILSKKKGINQIRVAEDFGLLINQSGNEIK